MVKQISEVLKLLHSAKRPVIFAGGGVRISGGQKLLLKLVERFNVPILTAMSANDLVPSDHKLFFGRPGAFGGERVGNFVIQNSDLLISIGVRHHIWTIGYDYKNFARAAKKVFIDIDKAEIEKPTVHPDIRVHADAKDFIEEMLVQSKKIKIPKYLEWLSYCRRIREKYTVVLSEYKKQKNFVNSYYFINVLSKLLPNNEIIVTSDGTAFSCTAQAIKIKDDQRLIYNVGCASMGYGLPAAIGACIANSKKRVVCLEGDGSIQLNIQELQTVVHHKLPLKIFVFNNDGYLAIKITQDSYFGGHHVGSDPKSGISFPDFQKISKAYGIPFLKIKNHVGMKTKIEKVLNSSGPFICEIMMDPNQPLIPKTTSVMKSDGRMIAKPLEDMYPFLPRNEFLDNMIIKPLAED